MGINVNVTEQQVLQGDTSIVRKEFEDLVQSSFLIKKFENDVAINFPEIPPLDMIKKLKTEKYRSWFEKLDREVPGVPYFLSQKSNTLLYYLMGNIPFEEKDNSIYFNELSAQRFFREKVVQIKNICLPNNINPQNGIHRLSGLLSGERESLSQSSAPRDEIKQESEKVKKGVAIKDLLDKYGSIAFMNRDRALKLTLVITGIPEKISFVRNSLVKDPRNPQPFFLTSMKTDSSLNEIRSVIFPSISDVEEAIGKFGGVYVQVVTKAEDSSYQSLFESENIFPVETVLEFNAAEEKSAVSPAEEPVPVPVSVKGTAVKDITEKEPASEHTGNIEEKRSDESEEILRLRAENTKLIKKVEQLQKLIETYEEEVHKKQSIKGFFRKFFD